MTTKKPTAEELKEGFKNLRDGWTGARMFLNAAAYVAVSDFAEPEFYLGGHEESVAEGYAGDHATAGLIVGDEKTVEVAVKHEMLEDWEVVKVEISVRAIVETLGAEPPIPEDSSEEEGATR